MGAFTYKDIDTSFFLHMHRLLDFIDARKKIQIVRSTKTGDSKPNQVVFKKDWLLIEELKKLVKRENASEIELFLKKHRNVFIDARTETTYTLEEIDLGHLDKSYAGKGIKGGGARGGSKVTELSEKAVCVILASLVHTGKFSLDENTTTTNINAVLDMGSGDSEQHIKEVIGWLKTDETWLNAAHRSATKLLQVVKPTKLHHFHRDSKFMKDLHKRFKDGLGSLQKLGVRINQNKWNPSDIWITTKTEFPADKDLASLNKHLMEKWANSEIRGVSLKKVGPTANWSEYNIGKQKNLFKFVGIEKQSKPWISKDVYICTKSGMKIQIRTFSKNSNIQCELQGGQAAGGKCGFGATKYLIQKITGEVVDDKIKIRNKGEDKVLAEINAYFSNVFKIGTNLDTFKREFKKKPLIGEARWDWLVSKYQALQIASIIKNDRKKQSDTVVTGIYGYAASLGLEEVFEASVYGKVY